MKFFLFSTNTFSQEEQRYLIVTCKICSQAVTVDNEIERRYAHVCRLNK